MKIPVSPPRTGNIQHANCRNVQRYQRGKLVTALSRERRKQFSTRLFRTRVAELGGKVFLRNGLRPRIHGFEIDLSFSK